MFNDGESQFNSEISQNVPNASMMMMMYSATFGNMGFTVQPASPGKIQTGFPSIPYLSLEGLLYNGQMSNPIVSPHNISSGSTAGTQNIQGQQTITDATGNIRVQMGTTGGF
jgi:hypothetical protein